MDYFGEIPSAGVISKSVAVGALLPMDLESHLLRLSIALLKIDSHDIILNFILNSNYLSHRLKAGGTGVNSGLDVPLLGGDGH